MWSTFVSEGVGFSTEASKEKHSESSSTQTEILHNEDKDSQVPLQSNAEVQTETSSTKEQQFVEFDVESLTSFLHRVTPYVCSVLEKNSRSLAFANYNLMSENDEVGISCQYLLDRSLPNEFCSPSVSWNAVGTAIAAGYSSSNHESWCEHDGSVGIWSLNRKDMNPKKPNIVLETDCCVTVVAFHPKLPAILLAGKFNGEILLWNISKEDDPLLGSSERTVGNHREPITGLHWLSNSKSSSAIEFVSCALDGKILLWRLENNTFKAYDGFIILVKELPRNFTIKTSKENAEVGIISLSVNFEDPSIFVIGTEGGGIFQGSFNALNPASYTGVTSVELKNPITMSFERHKGQVTSVQFSPFTRNIFLTSGSDGEVRLYNLMQTKPVMVLQLSSGGVNAACWSPIRPMVFSCACSDGELHVWDLMINKTAPTETITLDRGQVGGLNLQYNKENFQLLATSTTNGKISVWQLPETLFNSNFDEQSYLQKLAKNVE
ncbi:cytoplasmic dynein 2 intermediate chain 2-like [Uloborus diversus]|uniref:cytoplasmic dynein 2 intermediate chain 2-like n=1 Tax=Uloborus diversus TaxID=327109 RepID=UPI0024091509|nr:cytoplasmic dynein 2 intermediate chain 2-like [Uloborus diversus]